MNKSIAIQLRVRTGLRLGGTNGQQIYFSCPNVIQGMPVMNYGGVKGHNQNGEFVTWNGPAAVTKDNSFFATPGYWWVGNVRVYWRNANSNSWDSAEYSIPKTSSSDYINLSCTGLW